LANEEGWQPDHKSLNKGVRYHERHAAYDQARKEGTPEQVAKDLRLIAQGWKNTELKPFYTIYDCADRLIKYADSLAAPQGQQGQK